MKLIVTSPLRRSRLLKTGQITSYGSGSGVDDGALQKGIARAYAILTTSRYAGTTDVTLNGKTDAHSNNCVLDHNTGLMWSRYLSSSVGPASDGKLPWATNASGEGIFPYADAANAASLAGYTDWRVPNGKELESLLDAEAPTGSPDAVAFPSFTVGSWSSTTQPNNTANAQSQYLAGGRITETAKDSATMRLLLVRGG